MGSVTVYSSNLEIKLPWENCSLSQQHLVFLIGCYDSIQFLIPSYFYRILFHFIGTLYPGCSNPLALSSTQANSLFFSFIPSFTFLTQSLRLPVAPFHLLRSICVTFGMRSCTSVYLMLSKLFFRGVYDIPRGSKYRKDMSVLTFLRCLPPKKYQYVGSI